MCFNVSHPFDVILHNTIIGVTLSACRLRVDLSSSRLPY